MARAKGRKRIPAGKTVPAVWKRPIPRNIPSKTIADLPAIQETAPIFAAEGRKYGNTAIKAIVVPKNKVSNPA